MSATGLVGWLWRPAGRLRVVGSGDIPLAAVGAALNELLIGPMVRCGPGLPAGLELSAYRIVKHLLLGGTLRIDTLPGRWAALVKLPLTADYARR